MLTATYSGDSTHIGSSAIFTLTVTTAPTPPTVTSVAPTSGPSAGGTTMTITGTGFSTVPGATSITFGTIAATSVSCASTTQCTAVSPAGTAGSTVDIRVTVDGQTSAVSASDTFAYTPTISNVQTTAINSTGATITWTTDVPCDSQVVYGLTTSYGSSTPVDSTLVTSHSVVLSGLMPGTLYHFAVRSSTAGGVTALSDDFTFTTAPPSPRVYVANQQSNTVSVIEIASNTVVATVPVGTKPRNVAITPDGRRVYVTNQSSNSVSVIATVSNSVIATIAVGASPDGLIVSPDGSTVYVANTVANSVSVIETSGNTVVATTPVGTNPTGLAVTADGGLVYVTNQGSNTTSVIDALSRTVVATVPVGIAPYGVAVRP